MNNIYIISNKMNDLKYIGKTSRDIDLRLKEHYWNNVNTYMHKAMKSFGLDCFKVELLDVVNDEEALDKERYYIQKYNTIWPDGYNEMIGQSLEGGNNRMKGKHLSQSWRSKVGNPGIKNGRACKWVIKWLDTQEEIIVDLKTGISKYLNISESVVRKWKSKEHIDRNTGRPVIFYNIGRINKNGN